MYRPAFFHSNNSNWTSKLHTSGSVCNLYEFHPYYSTPVRACCKLNILAACQLISTAVLGNIAKYFSVDFSTCANFTLENFVHELKLTLTVGNFFARFPKTSVGHLRGVAVLAKWFRRYTAHNPM